MGSMQKRGLPTGCNFKSVLKTHFVMWISLLRTWSAASTGSEVRRLSIDEPLLGGAFRLASGVLQLSSRFIGYDLGIVERADDLPTALRTHSRRSSGAKGLMRKQVIPASRARSGVTSPGWAVMMTVGIPSPDAARYACSSSPVMPGIRTSATRQLTFARSGESRNVAALTKTAVA